jgi:Mitochondrial branched-chain alpha-ketoacid dehydrogenase kinase
MVDNGWSGKGQQQQQEQQQQHQRQPDHHPSTKRNPLGSVGGFKNSRCVGTRWMTSVALSSSTILLSHQDQPRCIDIDTRHNKHNPNPNTIPTYSKRRFYSTSLNCLNNKSTTPATKTFTPTATNGPDVGIIDRALLNEMSLEPQTSVSLQALMRTGRGEFLHKTFGDDKVLTHAATELVLIQVAGFLRRELPIRLAHRIQDLEGIPVLRDMDSVKFVRDLYVTSFMELAAFENKILTIEQENAFASLIERIYERHSSVLVQMARGAYEFRKAVRSGGGGNNGEFELQEETHAFLDRFYLCRIGIRVLLGQYLALRQPPVDNYVGIVCSQTSPYEIVKRSIDDAAFMCTRKYGDSPEVIISGRLDLSFPYVPTHLRKYLTKKKTNSSNRTTTAPPLQIDAKNVISSMSSDHIFFFHLSVFASFLQLEKISNFYFCTNHNTPLESF